MIYTILIGYGRNKMRKHIRVCTVCGHTGENIPFGVDDKDSSFRWCPKCYAYGDSIQTINEADLCTKCRKNKRIPSKDVCVICSATEISEETQEPKDEL